MAHFGKLQGSVSSFTNENTAALINLNLDFSLFRCETKAEYLPVGPALTMHRREEAETGQIHRTACTLGFLFQEILPDTPSLFKAYGRRVSEILAQPNINPRGTADDGPFQSFVGADCTSIWAAATSSDASIAIHLLACMLARAFDSKTATSIWFEIVQERKEQVARLSKGNKMIHPHTYLASQQAISRADLATWDTSARAWLRRADESKAWEKHQFALIVGNINLPFTAPGTTYSKVTTTWIKSMEVLNNLLENLPQQANDRAILLAISSWHLHPNLLVFQNTATNVDMKDPVFPPSAVLSLGLEYQLQKDQKEGTSIRWSLALSHLRYYGAPVSVRSNEDLSRVSMLQFWFVALGSLLRVWELRVSELPDAISWLDCLNKAISPTARGQYPEIGWIVSFCDTATRFLEADQATRSLGLQLVKFGWRRGHRLFGDEYGSHMPYFGLRNPHILRALEEDDHIDKGIVYLRSVASGIGLDEREVLLSFAYRIFDVVYYEWATIISLQRNESASNHRWIHFRDTATLSSQHQKFLKERRECIQSKGEKCCIISTFDDMPYLLGDGSVCWPNPPRVFDSDAAVGGKFRPITISSKLHHSTGWTKGQAYCIWVSDDAWDESLEAKVYTRLGDVESLRKSLDTIRNPQAMTPILGYLRSIAVPSEIVQLPSRKRKRSTSDSYNVSPTIKASNGTGAVNALMIQLSRPARSWLQSVMVLQIATLIYDQLPGATVSLRIVECELWKANWLPEQFAKIHGSNDEIYHTSLSTTSIVDWFQQMTRAEAFGCIAMFESGRFNIKTEHLEDVIALCAEDSIFVAGIVLRDPSTADTSGPQVRRLIGSIGYAGLVLLVSPLNPRIRPTGYDPTSVEHRVYDWKREDKFQGVSLHLSFTDWKMPLDWENTGEIDQEIFLLESVLSVMHNGQWVGDIDVLGLERDPIDVFINDCKGNCGTDGTMEHVVPEEIISLDDWEELLDPPCSVGVFRARSNWVARLSVVSILIQQNKGNSTLVVGGPDLCWKCLADHYACPEPHIPQIIID